jgi:hypothetical protein
MKVKGSSTNTKIQFEGVTNFYTFISAKLILYFEKLIEK